MNPAERLARHRQMRATPEIGDLPEVAFACVTAAGLGCAYAACIALLFALGAGEGHSI